MAPQDESNKKPRDDDSDELHSGARSDDGKSVELESIDREPEPFSDDDPFRAARIGEVVGETSGLLSEVQVQGAGFEGLTNREYADLHKNAAERKRWPEARQDGFISILRLGKPVPPRSKRVL